MSELVGDPLDDPRAWRSADPVDDFWEASSISSANEAEFTARVARHDAGLAGVHPFVGGGRVVPLRAVRDRTQRLLASRRSERSFSSAPLGHRDLERVLSAVGPARDGRRNVPEAGGFDAVFAFALARRVEGPHSGRVLRYDHRSHAVADVGAVPSDESLPDLFLLEPGADLPQLLVVFALDLRSLRTKYGARGARFALAQVGHASQNVALRLAADGLHGYSLGGGLDREILGVLGLAHTGARYGGAVACGR